MLLLWSLVFYGWGEPVYLFLMIGTIILNYMFGYWIHTRKKQSKNAKWILTMGVAANLLLLGFFKYAVFFVEQLKLIPALSGLEVPNIELPIGISFYVFQSMSYVIDVYRDDAPVQKNPLTFGTYVTLFPQLIAGPIVRYADVAHQMDRRRESISRFSSGVWRFVVGLSKKVLLANAMGLLWEGTRGTFGNVEVMGLMHYEGTLAAWVGIAAYAFQIYFDFSGYSDMAIGLGRMVGFEFLENFDYPYISKSITEFWRRWHISLSTWFKEYVYIPLGGNRKGPYRQILNLLIVWGLTGFWHGASWNFLLWGLYYAVLLIVEKLFLLKLLEKLPAFLGHIYAVFAVLMGWVLFYFVEMQDLGQFITQLYTPVKTSVQGTNLVLSFLPMLVICVICALPLGNRLMKKYGDTAFVRYGKLPVAAILILLCVASLASSSYNPFIYFRF